MTTLLPTLLPTLLRPYYRPYLVAHGTTENKVAERLGTLDPYWKKHINFTTAFGEDASPAREPPIPYAVRRGMERAMILTLQGRNRGIFPTAPGPNFLSQLTGMIDGSLAAQSLPWGADLSAIVTSFLHRASKYCHLCAAGNNGDPSGGIYYKPNKNTERAWICLCCLGQLLMDIRKNMLNVLDYHFDFLIKCTLCGIYRWNLKHCFCHSRDRPTTVPDQVELAHTTPEVKDAVRRERERRVIQANHSRPELGHYSSHRKTAGMIRYLMRVRGLDGVHQTRRVLPWNHETRQNRPTNGPLPELIQDYFLPPRVVIEVPPTPTGGTKSFSVETGNGSVPTLTRRQGLPGQTGSDLEARKHSTPGLLGPGPPPGPRKSLSAGGAGDGLWSTGAENWPSHQGHHLTSSQSMGANTYNMINQDQSSTDTSMDLASDSETEVGSDPETENTSATSTPKGAPSPHTKPIFPPPGD